MPEADLDRPGRRRLTPWRLAGATVLASLGVLVLIGTLRYEGSPATRTSVADQVRPPSTTTDASASPLELPDPTTTSAIGPTPSPLPGTPGTPPPPSSGPLRSASAGTSAAPVREVVQSPGAIRSSTPGVSQPTEPSQTPTTFSPVSVQAEDPGNSITGGAAVTSCGTCDGGARVRYLGRVVVYLDVPTAGTRTVTVTYESDGARELKVAINNAAPSSFQVSGTSWQLPRTLQFTAAIPAGRVAVTLYNDTSPAPDVDKVTIS
ncbi:hypothetical protein HCA58_14050 [Micromonospora sp. HNM0581]|uniref:hypothetical protein n=1 Tax=Micromonospora sp. HNM0581 TaxID=2716341 RepID=UPI00146EE0E1|nr:hypothetical protein [Micromonospora sp. HNM0581]NLU79484.1 hypothetical protein [Micromonospora sp. HNM0581]